MTTSSKPFVTIGGCAFESTVTYVDRGETVTWVNKDMVPHTVTGAALSWGHEKHLYRTDEVSYTFDEDGVYPYYCVLHPSMVGAVVVGDGKGPAGGAGVTTAAAAGASVNDTTPADPESGPSTSVVALAVGAALAACVLAARYLLGRRATAAPAP